MSIKPYTMTAHNSYRILSQGTLAFTLSVVITACSSHTIPEILYIVCTYYGYIKEFPKVY